MKTKNKRLCIDKKFILIACIATTACIIAACIFIATGSGQRRLNSLLDTGDRYLSELDYEQAVAAYLAAIDIDPKCDDAYLGLAEAYISMGNLGEALEILGEGYALTASGRIASKIEEANELFAQENGTDSAVPGSTDESGENVDAGPDSGANPGQSGTDPAQSGVAFVPWADAGLEDHVMKWDDEGLEQGMRELTGITEGDIMLSDVWEMTSFALRYRNIINITSLGELTNLTNLNLEANQISDIFPLGSLNNLTRLSLWGNQISDISPLSSLNNLIHLNLGSNQIGDISPLRPLSNLTELHLQDNQINDNDISLLSSLGNLTCLSLGSNQISNISPLSSLNNLTELHLRSNQISDISPLSPLNNLTCLDLAYNQISDISPLSSLNNLSYLYLGSNQISDVSPLSSLSNLSLLDLAYNQISDISPLSSLNNLTELGLAYIETITDYSPLDHFAEGVVKK